MFMSLDYVIYGNHHHFIINMIIHMVSEGCPTLKTFHMFKHGPSCLEVPTKLHLLNQFTSTTISIHRHLEHEKFLSKILLFWKTINIFNVIITTIGLESQNAREYPLLFR